MKINTKDTIGFLLFLMVIFFYLLSSFTIGSVIIFLLALSIFLIYWMSNRDTKGVPIKLNTLELFVLLFGIYAYCTKFWAYDSSYAQARGMTIIEMFVLIWLIYLPLKNLFSVDELLSILKWCGYVVVLGAYIYYGPSEILGSIGAGGRLPSTYLNSNTLGILAATTITIALYEVLRSKFRISDFLCIFCVVIIAASGSRKAMVDMVFGCIAIYFLLNQEKRFARRILGILAGIVLIIVFLYIVYSFQLFAGVNQRIQYMINMIVGSGEVDHSALMRQSLFEIGMQQFHKTPLFGMGIDNTRFLSRAYLNYDYYLHNNYVELLAGSGLIGTFLFYIIYAYALITMFRYRKNKDKTFYIIFVLIVTQLILDYGSVSYYAKETYMNMIVFYIYLDSLKEKSINSLSVV